MLRAIQLQNLGLGSKNVHADWIVCARQQGLPLFDPSEDEGYQLRALQLTTTWVDPYDGLVLRRATRHEISSSKSSLIAGRPGVL